MARPNVTVSVVDNSFTVVDNEVGSPHISGMYSSTTPSLLTVFGTTLEKQQKYMEVPSLGTWMALLNGTTFGGVTGQGPTAAWKNEWYSAYNYLLYGGTLLITDDQYTFYDQAINLDSVFTADINKTSQVNFVTGVISVRDDIMGVIGCTYEGYTGSGETVPSSPIVYPAAAGSASGSNIILVGGEKVTITIQNQTNNQETFINVPLAADVAGCMARTDRDATVWTPPAGTNRGRILNVVRLVKNLTNNEQDYLYDNNINPVIGVAGSGTFLFGDKTKEADSTSTLTRINVVRVINYIKRVLGTTAKGLLFEINDEATRSSFRSAATSLLEQIRGGRGLYDYRVVCDESNNPAATIDANQFVADVFIKPTKSINYIKIRITNLNTDAVI